MLLLPFLLGELGLRFHPLVIDLDAEILAAVLEIGDFGVGKTGAKFFRLRVCTSGKILAVLPKKQQVLIEGVRLIKKHTRKSQDNPQGAIVEREGPVHISNVKRVEEAEATSKTTKTKSKKKEKAS